MIRLRALHLGSRLDDRLNDRVHGGDQFVFRKRVAIKLTRQYAVDKDDYAVRYRHDLSRVA